MIKEQAEIESQLKIVRRLADVSNETQIEVNEVGWTSRVYVVDDGNIVFKFPRSAKFRDECKYEIATLKLLKEENFNLHIPVLNWVAEDNLYFGFYGVKGTPLREIIGNLTEAQKNDIGTQIGKFLRQLHSIKNYDDMRSKTLEEQAQEYQNWYIKGRKLLTRFLNKTEIKKIDDFFANEVPASMRGRSKLVLSHGDLDYNNTLIDDKNRVGIIDFGDAHLYDRSQDFRGIEDEVILLAMMESYGDKAVINKTAAQTTAKMIAVLNLIYCIENNLVSGVETIEKTLKRVRGDFWNIN